MTADPTEKLILNAFEEDLPWGDITSEHLIDPSIESRLAVLAKEAGVIAGMDVAEKSFKLMDATITWQPMVKNGDRIQPGDVLATVQGKALSLLKAERVALNFMQRLAGIATLTRQYVEKAAAVSSAVKILDTRKTTPGLRFLEKAAIRAGGGFNHRYCLSDAVLIKDNHLAILKNEGLSVEAVIRKIKQTISHTTMVELEVDSIDQIEGALKAGVDLILLDNMTPKQLKAAVKFVDGRVKLEASGGVNLDTVADIAATGVDFISVGALTHSAMALDISLDYSD